MSIKTLTCPNCGANINVAVSMAQAKCPACQSLFSTTGGPASPATRSAGTVDTETKTADGKPPVQLAAWIVVGTVLAVAITGLLVLSLTRGDHGAPAAPGNLAGNQSTAEPVAAEPQETQPAQSFRVVDLPESTRRQIFRDHKAMTSSSLGKAKRLPQDGLAGQSLNEALGGIVNQGVTQMALIHGVSEEDIRQIVAEGKAKGW